MNSEYRIAAKPGCYWVYGISYYPVFVGTEEQCKDFIFLMEWARERRKMIEVYERVEKSYEAELRKSIQMASDR
jgi:hypothetical protein